jgi:hypothetical protein
MLTRMTEPMAGQEKRLSSSEWMLKALLRQTFVTKCDGSVEYWRCGRCGRNVDMESSMGV